MMQSSAKWMLSDGALHVIIQISWPALLTLHRRDVSSESRMELRQPCHYSLIGDCWSSQIPSAARNAPGAVRWRSQRCFCTNEMYRQSRDGEEGKRCPQALAAAEIQALLLSSNCIRCLNQHIEFRLALNAISAYYCSFKFIWKPKETCEIF